MDFKKFAADASTMFGRAKQFTEEKLGTAERTELDAHFENLLQRAEKTREWTEKILKQTETVLQPNPNIRMEEFLMDKLEKKKRERLTNTELLGAHMIDAGNEFGPGTSYGNALVKCGQTEQKIGQAERELVQAAANNFLQPLRAFLDGDMKTVQGDEGTTWKKEKKVLEAKRLDLDAAKNKLRKAKAASKDKNNGPVTNNQSDDSVAKDLLVVATPDKRLMKAEAELRVAQSEFDRQAEITKLLLEGISSTHAHHLRCLNDFIESQMTYYAQCQQYMADLQRQLGRNDYLDQMNRIKSYTVGSGSHPLGLGGSIGLQASCNTSSNHPPQIGAVPSAPPQPSSNSSPQTPGTETRNARVLYDYDASDMTELSLAMDEIISVRSIPGLDSDWLMGERGNQRGKVPTTYLQIL